MAREMSQAEANYFMHTIKDPLIKSYLQNQVNSGQNMLKSAASLPVCPRCESAALHHQRGVICPNCGYEGHSPHKMRQHMKGGAFR